MITIRTGLSGNHKDAYALIYLEEDTRNRIAYIQGLVRDEGFLEISEWDANAEFYIDGQEVDTDNILMHVTDCAVYWSGDLQDGFNTTVETDPIYL